MVQTYRRVSPAHLERETRDFWLAINREWALEEHHVKILTAACEAWDRAQQARRALEEKGLTYMDRFGQPKARPEAAIERRNRTEFARLIRELGLDHVEPPGSRPPRIGGQQ